MKRAPSLLSCAVLLAALLGACATGEPPLVAGSSTRAEVEARLGPPAERLPLADGEEAWFWPDQPYGRVTWAAVFDAAGTLRRFEQRLTEANLKLLVPGKTTAAEVRSLFGPPYRILRYLNRDGDSWEWNMGPGPIQFWKHLSIRFDAQGKVAEVTYIDDPARNQRRRWPFGLGF